MLPVSVWNPEEEICHQELFSDFTGVDSIAAFLMSILVFVTVQILEHHKGGPLFELAGMEPYLKPGQDGYTGDDKPKQKSLDDDGDDDDDGLKKPTPAVQGSDESEEEAA